MAPLTLQFKGILGGRHLAVVRKTSFDPVGPHSEAGSDQI